jgi:hypothetical protein
MSTLTVQDFPRRIFLDSSTLQYLQTYGGFLYDYEELDPNARIHRDSRRVAKLHALRVIMRLVERAPFEFALSANTFAEVRERGNWQYLSWAYDVLHHWHACLEASDEPSPDPVALARIDSDAMNYLGSGDRALLRDAVAFECDVFLTMENKLPKNAGHICRMLGLRVVTPIELMGILEP